MDTITVNLNDLYQLIRRMRRDDMAYVTLSILPPEVIDGESCPASLELEGIRSSEPDIAVNYDSLDAVSVPVASTSMSRNML